MKTLIKKEIRLLLPAWVTAMLLAVVPPWILPLQYASDYPIGSLVQVLFPLGVLILGISSFGQEFSSGAMSHLLAQPLDRNRIWRTKTVILFVAFLLVCFAACASFLCRFNTAAEHATGLNVAVPPAIFWAQFRQDTLEALAISALVTFSGGLWTTLLLRQMTGAFWFTLLISAAIVMVITAALQASVISDSDVNHIIIVALVIYSIAGFFFARHLFLRAQDIQWTGGPIAFFSRRKDFQPIAIPRLRHRHHWFSALLWKEVQLHQANLLIAGLLLALNVASACILKVHARFKNPDITFMLEGVGILWLLMPLIIGSTAIAEERRIGILDAHLCLPKSRRTQLSIKFLVALVLSLVLGGATHLFLDHADNFGFWIFAIAATIFFLSFYASSFARSTVQAIGVTLAICTIYVGLLYFESIPIRLEFLTLCVGSAILLLVFGAMIFCNVDRLQEEAKLWRRNVISVVAAFAAVFVCSNGIYYRVWELCLPLQPPAGRERFHNSVQLHVQNSNTIYVVAPDGRLWTETMGYEHFKNGAFLSHEKSRTGFIGGSNWVDVAADDFQAVGVQSDGTLWSIQRKWDPRALRDAQTGPFTLAKIGSETDWSEAAADWLGFLLRKRDGSLWTWGTFEYDWKHRQSILKKFTEDRAELPVQIAGPATFENVFSSGSEAFARKTDGTLRRWIGWNDTNYVCALTNEPNIENQWATVVPGSHQSLGLKSNGELFLREKIWSSVNPRFETFQLGQNAKWRTATFRPPFTIWAIRDDGTLWEWVSSWDLSSHQQRKPVQLGSWSDWISVTRDWPGLALAADGSVWAWDQPSRHIWLGPSRKPIYIGNIYEGSPPGR